MENQKETLEQGLEKFNLIKSEIAKMSAEYMPITISGITDKENYKKAHEALMVVVKKRTATEQRRKELKAESLEIGRRIDNAAKEIFAGLEPIENHLRSQRDEIDRQKEEIRIMEERKLALPARINQLAELGMEMSAGDILKFDNAKWQEFILNERQRIIEEKEAAIRAQQEQIRKQQAAAAEAARIEQLKAEAAAKAKREAEEAAERERQRIIAEREAAERAQIEAEERARAAEEAAVKAKAEAEARAKFEAEMAVKRAEEERQRKAAEEAARIEAERIEAERKAAAAPDKEKLSVFVAELRQIKFPECSTTKAKHITEQAMELMTQIITMVEIETKKL